jgi:exopolysaccharide production protein ExoQ
MSTLVTTAGDSMRQRKRRTSSQPSIGFTLGLIWIVAFSLLGWLASISILANQGYSTALSLAAFILLPAIGLWGVARAGSSGGVHFLVMVVLVVLLSDLSLRGASTRLDAQSAVKFALWLSGLMLLPWRSGVLRLATKNIPTLALLLFGLWSLASTLYSISPLYTFAASLAFLGLWVTAVTLATSVDPARSVIWLTSTLFAMATASLVLYAAAPSIAMVAYENSTTLRLGGIFGNANALGGVSALALLLVVSAWYASITRSIVWLSVLVVPVCLTTLALSQSRTAMLGLVAGVTAVFVRRHPFALLPLVVFAASGTVLVFGYPSLIDTLIALVARSGRIEQVTTFTGRTEIWAFVLSAIEQAPLLGYGFASTKELIPAGYAGPYGWTTTSAHNLWLQTWVTTGAVGLILVLTSQLGSVWSWVKRPLPFRDGVCMYVLFVGLLEPGPMGPSVNLLTFIWIWATASSLRHPDPKA